MLGTTFLHSFPNRAVFIAPEDITVSIVSQFCTAKPSRYGTGCNCNIYQSTKWNKFCADIVNAYIVVAFVHCSLYFFVLFADD